MIFINARFRTQRITGVQRYATEIINRLKGEFVEVVPKSTLEGARAHLWEQAVLPFRSRNGVLWNPCATGPIITPSVVTIHDFAFIDHPEWFSKNFARAYQFIVPRVIANSKHILCVSEFTRERLVSLFGVNSKNIDVVPNGVELGDSNLKGELNCLSGLGFPVNARRFFLSVCSQEPRKNIPRLISAWKNVLPKLPKDFCLVLVGGKGSQSVFSIQGDDKIEEDRVFFTGYVSDLQLKTLYANAHAFIYPSLYEGFGLPPLEAMSFACPVLVSNTTSIPEVVGEAGLLFDPLSIESISKSIESVSSSIGLCEELKEKSLKQAGKFSWDTSAGMVQDILAKYC
ncbi:MAG: glycosyltransferase family 4 protein [Fibrobacterota bacterium]|nr:MAG: glycosyltransferase family 4 protein [Fibrobacterota bacterium]